MTDPQAILVRNHSGGATPCVGGTHPVGDIVAAMHGRPVNEGLQAVAHLGLDRQSVEPILTYCAEQTCLAASATCPGCRLRAQGQGLLQLDDVMAKHASIAATQTGVTIMGPGQGALEVESFAELAATFAGEEYWFFARRVLRKLRHGVRRAQMSGAPKDLGSEGSTPGIILVEPQLPDNIGMVARACANFGLNDLRLVAPRDGWPNEKARIAASGANFVIDEACAYPTLPDAMADLNWVAATTARQRDLRKPVLTPEAAVKEARLRIARGERCGFLFGRERNGLTTDEVANADAIIMIEVNAEFASLNLAQAVLIVGHEWMKGSNSATLGRVTTYEEPMAPGLNLGFDRLATKAEVEGLFGHLEGELERLGFFHPADKRASVVRNLRTALLRMQATEQEVRTLRGIVATLAHGKGAGRKG